jgi:alpha-beta hydrolase superfamily lysophospholipase
MEHFEGTFRGQGDVELYYQSWRPQGFTSKATLAIVHGFGEHSGRYGNVVNWFVPRGYAAIAFDVRGNGRSPGRRGYVGSFEEYRGDVRAFLDLVRAREPEGPLFLLGHSQGGLMVLDYVLHDPSGLDGVIASSPALGRLPVSPYLVLLARALSRVWPGMSLATGLDVTALSRDESVVQAYVDDPLVHNLGTPRLGTELLAAIEWTQGHAGHLKLPCLIVHGTDDRICPCEASQAFFEACDCEDKERITYEGGYHELFNDVDKERVLADVEAWLERHMHPVGRRAD